MSGAEEDYFEAYNDLEIHQLMLKDHPRTKAYEDAILKNCALFNDKVVLDVGAGTGILSLFAAKAGAKKVFAVEASGMAAICRGVVEENGYTGVIEVINKRVEDLQLPEKVDIIISEWMGFYLLHESMLDSVLFARDSFLKQPEGIMFPSHARIFAAPCSLPSLYQEEIEPWDNVYGFSMKSVKQHMLLSKASKPQVVAIEAEDLLSEPVLAIDYDLLWLDPADVQCFTMRKFVSAKKTGQHQGLCLWFDVDFKYDEGESLTLSTAPGEPSTHWKQTVLVLPSANEVEEGDILGWELTFNQSESNKRNYLLTLEGLDPETEEHPEPCYCQSVRCTLIAEILRKEAEEMGGDIIDM